MNRGHTREEYLDIIDKLVTARSDIGFSSDFIVGFPGETDEDFADTLDLIKRVKFAQCYSFTYSPRPGTPAATKTQILEKVKKERLHILQAEIAKYQLEYNHSSIGKIMPILFNRDGKHTGQIVGNSPYMQSVYIDNPLDNMLGTAVNVLIKEASISSLKGVVV